MSPLTPLLFAVVGGAASALDDTNRRARLHELANRLGVVPALGPTGTAARIAYVRRIHGDGAAMVVHMLTSVMGIPDEDFHRPHPEDVLIPWLGRIQVTHLDPRASPMETMERMNRWLTDIPAVRDWVLATRPDLTTLDWSDALSASNAWHADLAAHMTLAAPPMPPGPIVFDFGDGWTVQDLDTVALLRAEGVAMGNCVHTHHVNRVMGGGMRIFSLRDPANRPVVDISKDEVSGRWLEVKGRGNAPAVERYQRRVLTFLLSHDRPALEISPPHDILGYKFPEDDPLSGPIREAFTREGLERGQLTWKQVRDGAGADWTALRARLVPGLSRAWTLVGLTKDIDGGRIAPDVLDWMARHPREVYAWAWVSGWGRILAAFGPHWPGVRPAVLFAAIPPETLARYSMEIDREATPGMTPGADTPIHFSTLVLDVLRQMPGSARWHYLRDLRGPVRDGEWARFPERTGLTGDGMGMAMSAYTGICPFPRTRMTAGFVEMVRRVIGNPDPRSSSGPLFMLIWATTCDPGAWPEEDLLSRIEQWIPYERRSAYDYAAGAILSYARRVAVRPDLRERWRAAFMEANPVPVELLGWAFFFDEDPRGDMLPLLSETPFRSKPSRSDLWFRYVARFHDRLPPSERPAIPPELRWLPVIDRRTLLGTLDRVQRPTDARRLHPKDIDTFLSTWRAMKRFAAEYHLDPASIHLQIRGTDPPGFKYTGRSGHTRILIRDGRAWLYRESAVGVTKRTPVLRGSFELIDRRRFPGRDPRVRREGMVLDWVIG
jgi:hypothetical protein